jgi:hypothetical protein
MEASDITIGMEVWFLTENPREIPIRGFITGTGADNYFLINDGIAQGNGEFVHSSRIYPDLTAAGTEFIRRSKSSRVISECLERLMTKIINECRSKEL